MESEGGRRMDVSSSKSDDKSGKAGMGIPGLDSKVNAPASESGAFGLPFVLNYWREFDLETARTTMDEQGLKVAEHQEASTRNRRKLAESTRDFRKASSAEQPKLFVGLLKSYQEEVDNLTKRAKFAESAFLSLYQKLYEAPDPVPALASAAEVAGKVAELSQENRKMNVELEEFRAESFHLKNQQATVRRLEERNRQLEQLMEEKVKEMVSMKQHVLAEESQKSVEALKEREEALQEQLRVARESLENMQRLHDMGQSQLFEVRAKSEEEKETKQYEVNLLTDEVERAQSRLISLEREKEALKAQLKDTGSFSNNRGESTVAIGTSISSEDGSVMLQHSWEAAIRAKEAIISELHAELHTVESNAGAERESHLAEVKRLHAILQAKEDEIQELTSELSVRPSAKQWEDLRKQVKILQAVGYNAVEVDDWEVSSGDATGLAAKLSDGSGKGRSSGAGGGEMGRLEALLLEKNRKVEHELTQAKVQLSEKSEEAKSLRGTVVDLESKVEDQKKLILKLEEDILKGSNKTGEALGARGASGRGLGSPAKGQSGHALSGLMSGGGRLGIGVGGGVGDGDGGDALEEEAEEREEGNTVLAVVCAQRDRFRQRLNDLEEELRLSRDKNVRLTAEVEKLKADNVKLYERMRYVQSYASSSSGTSDKPQPRGRKRADDIESGDVEQKYKKMYEDGLNPFAAFSTKERELRYKELGMRDWIALTSGKFLLSNKHARTFVFFYSIALHMLVFMSMYRLAHFSHQSIKFHDAQEMIRFTPASIPSTVSELARTAISAMSPATLPSEQSQPGNLSE